jgi:hypothetical protein
MEIWEVFSQYVFYLPIAARNSGCNFWWILQTTFKFYFLSFHLNNLFHYFMQIPLFLSSSVTLKDGPIFFLLLTIISVIVYLKSFSPVEDIYFSVNKWKGTQHTVHTFSVDIFTTYFLIKASFYWTAVSFQFYWTERQYTRYWSTISDWLTLGGHQNMTSNGVLLDSLITLLKSCNSHSYLIFVLIMSKRTV